jgi:hypothetical protein
MPPPHYNNNSEPKKSFLGNFAERQGGLKLFLSAIEKETEIQSLLLASPTIKLSISKDLSLFLATCF